MAKSPKKPSKPKAARAAPKSAPTGRKGPRRAKAAPKSAPTARKGPRRAKAAPKSAPAGREAPRRAKTLAKSATSAPRKAAPAQAKSRPGRSSLRFESREAFHRWVALEMGKLQQHFFSVLPETVRARLDSSRQSLQVLETWLVQRYPSPHHLALPDAHDTWQGAAAYLGETLRKVLGGIWNVDLENKSDLYFDRPVIDHFEGCLVPLCPELLVTMVIQRRTGHELREILDSLRPPPAVPPPSPPSSGSWRLGKR